MFVLAYAQSFNFLMQIYLLVNNDFTLVQSSIGKGNIRFLLFLIWGNPIVPSDSAIQGLYKTVFGMSEMENLS